MRFLRLFLVDVREGFVSLWRWYAVSIVFFVLCIVALYLQAASFRYDAISFSLGDYLVSFVAGMSPFDPNLGEPFHLPITWIVLFLLVSYLTLWYPYRDLMGAGKQIMVVGGSRWAWWLAKCAWIATTVTAFFLIALFVAATWTLVSGGDFSLHTSAHLPELMDFICISGLEVSYDAHACLVAIPAATIALCLVQLLLSLVIRPPLSYVATLAMLFVSAFYYNPWLIGNYLMAARSSSMMPNGLSAEHGVMLAGVLALTVVVGGGMVLSRKDILNKEELS